MCNAQQAGTEAKPETDARNYKEQSLFGGIRQSTANAVLPPKQYFLRIYNDGSEDWYGPYDPEKLIRVRQNFPSSASVVILRGPATFPTF